MVELQIRPHGGQPLTVADLFAVGFRAVVEIHDREGESLTGHDPESAAACYRMMCHDRDLVDLRLVRVYDAPDRVACEWVRPPPFVVPDGFELVTDVPADPAKPDRRWVRVVRGELAKGYVFDATAVVPVAPLKTFGDVWLADVEAFVGWAVDGAGQCWLAAAARGPLAPVTPDVFINSGETRATRNGLRYALGRPFEPHPERLLRTELATVYAAIEGVLAQAGRPVCPGDDVLRVLLARRDHYS